MKSNYRRIGDFIALVDERNKKLEVDTLVGLSISKEFIPSVANTIGTNMANYKIIRKNQFACSLMQVRRDKKIPVALLQKFDEAIISQAYPVFQVKDENELSPQYLMMWMSRSEFDRQACFLAVGGVRGSLEWDDFCDMELPIPSIEKQRAIVKEYNTIVNRIKLNEQLNQKLEETAQALYKHWFVDFEFPNADGNPYKSSGGTLVYNTELDKEIPEGWEAIAIYDVAIFINGASFKDSDFTKDKTGIPIVKIAELKSGLNSQTKYTNQSRKEELRIHNGTMLYSWSGNPETSLEVFKWFEGEAWLNQHIFKVDFSQNQNVYFTYYTLKNLKQNFIKLAEGKQTTGLGHVTVADMKSLYIPYPSHTLLKNLIGEFKAFYDMDSIKQIEVKRLKELKNLLLSKMTKVELEQSGNRPCQTEKEAI